MAKFKKGDIVLSQPVDNPGTDVEIFDVGSDHYIVKDSFGVNIARIDVFDHNYKLKPKFKELYLCAVKDDHDNYVLLDKLREKEQINEGVIVIQGPVKVKL